LRTYAMEVCPLRRVGEPFYALRHAQTLCNAILRWRGSNCIATRFRTLCAPIERTEAKQNSPPEPKNTQRENKTKNRTPCVLGARGVPEIDQNQLYKRPVLYPIGRAMVCAVPRRVPLYKTCVLYPVGTCNWWRSAKCSVAALGGHAHAMRCVFFGSGRTGLHGYVSYVKQSCAQSVVV